MANQVSQLLNHVVSVFDANPLVNTIVFKDDDVFDVEKENIYPLVSMRIVNSIKESNLVLINIEFEIFNQRDKSPKSTPSKLMTDTNFVDNLNICDAIGNDFLLEITKSHNDLDINAEEYSDFVYVSKDERNCLDGVKFDITFGMHQNGI